MNYTDEQLSAMSKEELIRILKNKDALCILYFRKCERLAEILSSIGIAYDTYKREFKDERA